MYFSFVTTDHYFCIFSRYICMSVILSCIMCFMLCFEFLVTCVFNHVCISALYLHHPSLLLADRLNRTLVVAVLGSHKSQGLFIVFKKCLPFLELVCTGTPNASLYSVCAHVCACMHIHKCAH